MRRALFAVAVSIAAGCSERTQALIRVETDLLGDLLMRTRALAADGSRDESTLTPLVANATFGVAPRGELDQPVVVFVDAFDASERLIVTATRTIERFEKGRTLELTMFLARACSVLAEVRRTCPVGQTCSACGCEPDNVDVVAMVCPPPEDAGVIDSGEPDTGEPDTGAPLDLGAPPCTDGQLCGPAIDCTRVVKTATRSGDDIICTTGRDTRRARCMNGACPGPASACIDSPPGTPRSCGERCQKIPCVPGASINIDDNCAADGEVTDMCRGYMCFRGEETETSSLSCRGGRCVEGRTITCDEECDMSLGCVED